MTSHPTLIVMDITRTADRGALARSRVHGLVLAHEPLLGKGLLKPLVHYYA